MSEESEANETSQLDRLVMPRVLTAENGAKGLLSGEFYEEVEVACPDCDGSQYYD